jgi:hypothetical protein
MLKVAEAVAPSHPHPGVDSAAANDLVRTVPSERTPCNVAAY